MLPQKNRIPKLLFETALKRTKVIQGQYFKLRFLGVKNLSAQAGKKQSQFSFITPKTVSKKAVQRNLLRRRGYSIIQKNLKNIKNPLLAFFFFNKDATGATYKELEADIMSLLKKIQAFDF